MIRTTLLQRPAPRKQWRPATSSHRRCFAECPVIAAPAPCGRKILGMAPAVLLLGALLTAGCGEDNQRVSEHFPSGARPAPVPSADLAAGLAELPPPPPAEPQLQPPPPAPAAPPAKNPPAGPREEGQAATAAAAASPPAKH
jgi:hypothetical protein